MSTLLGEWGFLDNLDDTSGNEITATANFSPTFIDGPVPGTRAIRFTGAGQTVTYGRAGLEPAAADGGICTMAWVKLFSPHSNYTQIIHKTRAFDSTKHAIDISGNSAFLMARWRDQLVFRETGDQFADEEWHHVVNIDADDRYAWLVDGVAIQGAARSGSSPVSWENFPWLSGFAPNMQDSESATNVAFTGIRIFSGTMSNTEALDWMNTPVVPAGRSGKPKVWDGDSWNNHQAKVWDGSSWNSVPMAGHNGTDWVTAT
jgi:hypothetical protein